MSSIIPNSLIGVQPMSAPTGKIFTIKTRYGIAIPAYNTIYGHNNFREIFINEIVDIGAFQPNKLEEITNCVLILNSKNTNNSIKEKMRKCHFGNILLSNLQVLDNKSIFIIDKEHYSAKYIKNLGY